jgi:hypothetical protein
VQFKTLKYHPAFPTRLGSIQDARAYCHVFFPWYKTESIIRARLADARRRASPAGRATRRSAGDRARCRPCPAPGAILGRPHRRRCPLGTLRPGAVADVTLLRVETGSFVLTDSMGETMTAGERLVPVHVVKGGVARAAGLQ